MKHKIKTTIPKLQKEKFDLEMKFSKVNCVNAFSNIRFLELEKRARMLEDDNGKLTSDVALLRNLEVRHFLEQKFKQASSVVNRMKTLLFRNHEKG